MTKPKAVKPRRNFMLLEVLIAFAIASLAILPLLAPHFAIFRQQVEFNDKIELDIAVNRIYGQIIEKLHRNQISWADIEKGTILPVDDSELELPGTKKTLPFKGNYQFRINRSKKNELYGLYYLDLTIAFEPRVESKKSSKARDGSLKTENRPIYKYNVFAGRWLEA